jgi:hypothetical protein
MYDISDKLYTWLQSLSKEKVIEVLLGALDEMQSYNGNSKTTCIMRAAGATEVEDKNGKLRWCIKD